MKKATAPIQTPSAIKQQTIRKNKSILNERAVEWLEN